jgi:hypothetical protein
VRIKEIGGVFIGTHRKAYWTKTTKPTMSAKECTDDRKDKPVLGMTIMRNQVKAPTTRPSGMAARSSTRQRQGLHTRLKPVDGGKKLEMRGYIGPFYRTQVWIASSNGQIILQLEKSE